MAIQIQSAHTGDIHLRKLRSVVNLMLEGGQSFCEAESVLTHVMQRMKRDADLLRQFESLVELDPDLAQRVVADGWGALNNLHPDHEVDLPFDREPKTEADPQAPQSVNEDWVRYYADALEDAVTSENPVPMASRFYDILCAMLTQVVITVLQSPPHVREIS